MKVGKLNNVFFLYVQIIKFVDEEETSDREDENQELEEEEEEQSDSEIEDEESYADGTELLEDENDNNFRHMKSTDLKSQMTKAVCVRNQVSMWESILEMRIQLQKCLISANKMPQGEYYKEIAAESGTEFSEKTKEVKNTVTNLLEKFLMLQSLLLSQYPDTKTLLSKKVVEAQNKDDEEIPSEDEEIESENEEIVSENEEVASENEEITKDNEEVSSDRKEKDVKTNGYSHKAKRRKLEYYGNSLKNFHEKYKPYCNNIIQKWNDQTRIVLSKKNEGNVLNQIQYSLSDKAKLIKKTQLKRSNYQIMGQENDEQYNTEIFDDDDFYHQLLTELIKNRSADLTDPIQLSRQWIQLQNWRTKMKKNVNTKATKGRRIRYAVHSKLVNFMAPIDDRVWTEEAKTDLFKSLFRGER